MPTSFQIARSLLAVDRKKELAVAAGFPVAPLAIGIINLLFCAMMDSIIRADRTDHHMLLFMFVECSAVALVCSGVVMHSMADIIARTSVFPVGAWSYLLFLLAGFAKRPVVAGLFLTAGLFVGVADHVSALRVALNLAALALGMAVVEAAVAVVSLLLIRSMQPAAIFGLLVASAAVAIVGATLLFDVDSFLRAVPVVGWTVKGFSAARSGDVAGIVGTFACDVASLIGLGLLGRFIR